MRIANDWVRLGPLRARRWPLWAAPLQGCKEFGDAILQASNIICWTDVNVMTSSISSLPGE